MATLIQRLRHSLLCRKCLREDANVDQLKQDLRETNLKNQQLQRDIEELNEELNEDDWIYLYEGDWP